MSTGEAPASPRSTRGQRALIATAILIFAAVAAYLALVIITHVDSIFFPGNEISIPGGSVVNKVLPGVDATGDSGSNKRINILVMGLDRRPSDGDLPTRTDTLFVVTVDPKTKSSSILGIPRDLLVDIPGKQGGTYQDRVNTIYVAGELSKYPEGGVGLMKEVLAAQPFNIKIDKYVIVDFPGFQRIIDALGGVDVDVPDEVYDPYYSESEKPGDYNPQHFYPGTQHMDGATALAYSRIRFSSDDLDRIQRQQRVIFAAIDKAKSLDVLKNGSSLWSKYKDAINTDISDTQIPGYAILANQVKDNLRAVSLGSATVPCNQGAAQVLCGSKEQISKITAALFTDKPDANAVGTAAAPAPVRVEVQNGTGTDSLARRVIEYIASKGYPIDDLNANNATDGELHAASEIIDVGGDNQKNAYLLASWLKIPIGQIRNATPAEVAGMSSAPDIVVILGGDVDYGQLIQSPATTEAAGG